MGVLMSFKIKQYKDFDIPIFNINKTTTVQVEQKTEINVLVKTMN